MVIIFFFPTISFKQTKQYIRNPTCSSLLCLRSVLHLSRLYRESSEGPSTSCKNQKFNITSLSPLYCWIHLKTLRPFDKNHILLISRVALYQWLLQSINQIYHYSVVFQNLLYHENCALMCSPIKYEGDNIKHLQKFNAFWKLLF